MLAPNTILQNRYRVIRELGHGGMGTVYEALDQRVNCIVALKETLNNRDNEARRVFEHEAALLANLRHQALPKVMDYFSEDDRDFLVMEFIAGQDLSKLLASQGSFFPLSQVLGWADELLKLLEYLHTRQPPILHRDIKPANLKLTDRGEIFLLDFGLAKGSAGQMLTLATSRSVFGYTPSYAPLEQILGQGTDVRSDIYSVGATLYHLLTGIAPIDAPTRFHALEDEQPDPLKRIEQLNPRCSATVAAIIHQAMAISRKQRPISAVEIRLALGRALVEEGCQNSEEEAHRRGEAEERRKLEENERIKRTAAEAKQQRQEKEEATRRRKLAEEVEARRLREGKVQELIRERDLRSEVEALKHTEKELRRRREERLHQIGIVMPQMGESIKEGTITKWLKRVGDSVDRDEPLFEISTDKVDAEIPSPAAGVLSEIRFKEGETVEVNTIVAMLNGQLQDSADAQLHVGLRLDPMRESRYPREVEVVMPQMGESIKEGTITKWLKQIGDDVDRDEPLFEISTDKVDAEIPSPAAGVLIEIRFKEGDTVEVNTTVALLKQFEG